MEEFNHSQDDVAQIVGKSRPHVANTLRLLKLSEPVQALVASGQLSAGHARILVGQPNALELAARHHQARLERAPGRGGDAQGRRRAGARRAQEAKGHTSGAKDADTSALERRLSDALGPGGGGRSPRRRRRHAAHQVSRFGSVGWGVEEVGSGLRRKTTIVFVFYLGPRNWVYSVDNPRIGQVALSCCHNSGFDVFYSPLPATLGHEQNNHFISPIP